ncbi:hypothetical protein [Salinarimonas rosea]|uniref:hypothetical protein n=1 Tax=Salinarimonas rosea TaxID=552063 RepID=UPI000407F6B9|nr:hypothetical protein [Salinarimonas rosea]
MATIRRDEQVMTGDAPHGEAQDAEGQLRRTVPVWPGFRAARLITSMKIRGDARSTVVLALVIIAATLAVLGAAHVSTLSQDLGGLFGLSLRASESAY